MIGLSVVQRDDPADHARAARLMEDGCLCYRRCAGVVHRALAQT
jgi:hypothetical protein